MRPQDEAYSNVFNAAVEMHSVGQRTQDVVSIQLSALLFHISNLASREIKGCEAVVSAANDLSLTYREVIVESARAALESELNDNR